MLLNGCLQNMNNFKFKVKDRIRVRGVNSEGHIISTPGVLDKDHYFIHFDDGSLGSYAESDIYAIVPETEKVYYPQLNRWLKTINKRSL